MHVAQVNIALPREPLESPLLAEFAHAFTFREHFAGELCPA